jgi:hypothetical protein
VKENEVGIKVGKVSGMHFLSHPIDSFIVRGVFFTKSFPSKIW